MYRNKILLHLKENRKKYFLLIVFFILGIVIGSLSIKVLSSSQIEELVGYMKNFFTSVSASDSSAIDTKGLFREHLIRDAKTYLILFFLGLSAMGCFYAPLLFLFKGFILGFTNAFLIINFGFKGFLFSLISIIPQNFLKMTILLFAAVTAFSLSLNKVGNSKKKYPHKTTPSLFFSYLILFLIAFIINLLPLMFESYVVPLFMFLFSPELL